MKIRALHPEFFTDAAVASLTMPARLLFAGLWCHSDDYGRGRWLPKSIEGDVFPRDEVDINALLSELLEARLIHRYVVGGETFFQVRSWEKYQRPKYRANTSIPEPLEAETPSQPDPGQVVPNPGTNPGQAGTDFGLQEEVLEEVLEEEEVLVLAPKPARDEVWDELAGIFGDPTTRSNKSLRGKLVKSLSAAGATALEIRTRVQAWPLHFPDATLTETALEKHWDRLGRIPARASPEQMEVYEAEQRAVQRQFLARQMERGLPG